MAIPAGHLPSAVARWPGSGPHPGELAGGGAPIRADLHQVSSRPEAGAGEEPAIPFEKAFRFRGGAPVPAENVFSAQVENADRQKTVAGGDTDPQEAFPELNPHA